MAITKCLVDSNRTKLIRNCQASFFQRSTDNFLMLPSTKYLQAFIGVHYAVGMLEGVLNGENDDFFGRSIKMKREQLLMLVGLAAGFILAVSQARAEPAAGTGWTEPKTGMEFVWVPTGCFNMGSSDGEKDEQPVHKVCLKGFWMGRYEVTQTQYQQMMGNNPSKFRWPSNPVEQVSLGDAKGFAEEMSHSTGTKVRLPSEAEWEYACSAGGTHETYCGSGGKPDRLAWHYGNSGKQPHPVGQLAANNWGLYDMSGNVEEWTQDCWNGSYNGAPDDGSAWKSGDCGRRVVRGGSLYLTPPYVHAANRNNVDTSYFHYSAGFRVARTLP